MRQTAPAAFDAAAFYQGVQTFQDWDVFPGHHVAGIKPVMRDLNLLGVPDHLAGSPRVLEIGPWNGFFGFELLRRGAGELVALGPDDPDRTGWSGTVRLLEIESRVRYIRDSVYHIASHRLGAFDLVLFLGVVYHLRHPLLALDLLHDHSRAGGMLLLDSPTIDHVHRIAPPAAQDVLGESWKSVRHVPLAAFVRGGVDTPLAADAYNWYVPNSTCLRGWVRSSGFEISREYVAEEWMWLQARRVDRPFAPGLEGFNSASAGKAG